MSTEHVIGFTAGIFTGVSLLPQLIKILKSKQTEDISKWMLLILMAGLALWIIYGIKIKNFPIIVTNSFSLFVNLIILVFYFLNKKSSVN